MNSACAEKVVDFVPESGRPVVCETQVPPTPLSITHLHLLSCIKSWLSEAMHAADTIRILDVGCGDGLLIRYLTEALNCSHPHLTVEIYGMDVHDHGVQASGYFSKTQNLLTQSLPSVQWKSRLRLVSVSDPWPFPDGFFDVVVSNQVLEHVGNHNYFFSQHRRVMKQNGAGFHLFPLWHCIFEPHLRMPLVHWVSQRDRRARAIMLASRMGFGKFKGRKSELAEYADAHADYLVDQVNYKTQRQIARSACETGLVPSFAKSHHYYLQKLRSIGRRPAAEHYASNKTLTARGLAVILRYISSSTLELRAPDLQHGQRQKSP